MGEVAKKCQKREERSPWPVYLRSISSPFVDVCHQKVSFTFQLTWRIALVRLLRKIFLGKKFYSHGWKKYYITTFFPATPFLYIQYMYIGWHYSIVFNSLFDTGTIILWFYSFQLYSIPLGTNPSTSKVFSDRKLECM